MPGLEMFGRRWHLGSDDLAIPGIIEGVTHVVDVILIIAVYAHSKEADCVHQHSIVVAYFACFLFTHTLYVCLAAGIVYIATRGTPLEVGRRSSVVYLLYATAVLSLSNLALMLIGSWATFVVWRVQCSSEEYSYLKGCLISYWFFSGLKLLFLFCFYDTVGHTNLEYHKPWKWRCSFLFCCASRSKNEGSSNITEDVSQMFSAIFRWLDLVPSDVIVGLICLNAQEKLSPPVYLAPPPHEAHQVAETAAASSKGGSASSSNCSVPPEEGDPAGPAPSAAVLRDLSHFTKYFMGTYGWPVLTVHHPLTCCCRLCGHCSPGIPHNGDPLYANIAAILSYTRLKKENIIFVKMRNKVFTPAYYIALDDEVQAVVLSFRGTRSLEDTLTDLAVKLVPFEVDGVGTVQCHEGFARAARNSFAELEQQQRLHDALAQKPTYRLVVLGHSLGAAVATLVSMMLRPRYGSRVACFAYAPPQVLTKGDLRHTGHVVSCVLWKDLVPRMSVRSLVRWRDDIVSALAHCRCSKWDVIAAPFCPCLSSGFRKGQHRHPEALVWAAGASEAPARLLQQFHAQQRRREEEEVAVEPDHEQHQFHAASSSSSSHSRGDGTVCDAAFAAAKNLEEYPPLYPPGRIVHILRCPKPGGVGTEPMNALKSEIYDYHHNSNNNSTTAAAAANRRYVAVWAAPENFERILTSPSMWKNHMPWKLHRALRHITATTTTTTTAPTAATTIHSSTDPANCYAQSTTPPPSHERLAGSEGSTNVTADFGGSPPESPSLTSVTIAV